MIDFSDSDLALLLLPMSISWRQTLTFLINCMPREGFASSSTELGYSWGNPRNSSRYSVPAKPTEKIVGKLAEVFLVCFLLVSISFSQTNDQLPFAKVRWACENWVWPGIRWHI